MKDTRDLYKEEIEELSSKRKEIPIIEPKQSTNSYNKPFKLTGIIKSISRNPTDYINRTYMVINGIKPNMNIEIISINKVSYYLNKNYKIGDKVICTIYTQTYKNTTQYYLNYIKNSEDMV